jgi:hypothetical protein
LNLIGLPLYVLDRTGMGLSEYGIGPAGLVGETGCFMGAPEACSGLQPI